ncbi:MAG: DAK2 domain-containing protein [Candidatus Aminicenantaceae bacterium]
MKIKYLNGSRLYYGFLAGGEAVIKDQKHLNKINVFPVADADTGSNLASTMRSIEEGTCNCASISETLNSLADSALAGARGNSGLIFAQFIQGFKQATKNEVRLSTRAFGEKVKSAVQQAYQAMTNPIEGTMLTVMRDWAEEVYRHRTATADFTELLTRSLQTARRSLGDTPKKLSVLAKAGVVDAGAKGFVDFLEGIVEFTREGKLKKLRNRQPLPALQDTFAHTRRREVKVRFCAEALVAGRQMDLSQLKQDLNGLGESVIVAGSPEKAKIHVHTNDAAAVFQQVFRYGSIIQIKADDMLRQFQAAYEPKTKTAVVTDSACDLPKEWMEQHQIHMIPLQIVFGENLFLDKITITPQRFYSMLQTEKNHPLSAIPGLQGIVDLLSFLSSHYESVVMISISGKLSGMLRMMQQAAGQLAGKNIHVIDSRNLSASEGLVVIRAAEALEAGTPLIDVLKQAEEWVSKTHILVDIQTLKYMVRGGRVSPLKGRLAQILNLKPIVTLDEEGKAAGEGKSFSRRNNLVKIVRKIEQLSRSRSVWKYALVHADNPVRAQKYAQELTRVLQKPPAYISPLSPVVGVHNGIGAVGICYMFE